MLYVKLIPKNRSFCYSYNDIFRIYEINKNTVGMPKA